MSNLYYDSQNITVLYYGDIPIQKMYCGSNLIFDVSGPPAFMYSQAVLSLNSQIVAAGQPELTEDAKDWYQAIVDWANLYSVPLDKIRAVNYAAGYNTSTGTVFYDLNGDAGTTSGTVTRVADGFQVTDGASGVIWPAWYEQAEDEINIFADVYKAANPSAGNWMTLLGKYSYQQNKRSFNIAISAPDFVNSFNLLTSSNGLWEAGVSVGTWSKQDIVPPGSSYKISVKRSTISTSVRLKINSVEQTLSQTATPQTNNIFTSDCPYADGAYYMADTNTLGNGFAGTFKKRILVFHPLTTEAFDALDAFINE